MTYFVIAHDGNRYGPADLPDLQGWVREGRLLPTSTLENALTNERISAANVPGLFSGQAVPPTIYNPSNYPHNPYQGYPQQDGRAYVTSAWIFGTIGLLACPILFSSAGIILGVIGNNKGTKSGVYAAIYSGFTLVVGVVLGMMVARMMRF